MPPIDHDLTEAIPRAPDPQALRDLLPERWNGHWATAPVETVLLRQLTPTQHPHYHPCKAAALRCGRPHGAGFDTRWDAGDLPHVVLWRGHYYIRNGHHRVAVALRDGEVSMAVRVRALRQ